MNPSLMLVLSLNFSAPHRVQSADRWFGTDKVKHFAMGMFVQSLGYGTIRVVGGSHASALGGATLGTATVGTWKELRDRSRGSTVSTRDLVWTLAGGGSAAVLLAQTRR